MAEAIVHSIRARGHKVFFDRDRLPPGGTYEDRIESEIGRSNIFVFLISAHSLAPGGFALTELGLAQQKWERPAGRVLPVLIDDSGYDAMPAYLRSVTVLEPKGNVAAETAARIDAMRYLTWGRLAPGLLAVGTVAVAAAWYFYPAPQPELRLTAKQPIPWERGYLGMPAVYNLIYEIANTGALPGKLVSARLVSTPSDALSVVDTGPEYSAESPTFVEPGGQVTNRFEVTVEDANSDIRWRICADELELGDVCSEDQTWAPVGDFSPATAFTLPDQLSSRTIAVAAAGDDFIVAAVDPNAVYRIAADGAIKASRNIDGEPTALYADSEGIWVGTRGPDEVLKIVGPQLVVGSSATVGFPSSIRGGFDDPVSSTPVSIGRAGDRLWVITRGGAAGSGLIHFSMDLTDPQVPPYFDEIDFDLRDMHLSSNGIEVWGAQTDTTPASLFRFTPERAVTYSGHDYDIAACATDVLVRAEDLLIPDCDGFVRTVVAQGGELRIQGSLESLTGFELDPSRWTEVRLRGKGDGAAAFLVRTARGGDRTSSLVNILNPVSGLKVPLSIEGPAIRDLAAGEDAFVVVIQDSEGDRETLALRYE